MSFGWLEIWMALAACALVQSFLIGMHSWEHRRFVRRRLAKPRRSFEPKKAWVLAPCKGLDHELAENIGPLLRQDYDDYQVVFIVESEDDPAFHAIHEVLNRSKVSNARARLLVAGRATQGGQKIHNLSRATAIVPEDVRILAFVDSDARPTTSWLRDLVQRIDDPGIGAATGYRWFMPRQANLPTLLLCSINTTVACGFSSGWQNLVWGGSWAIRREVFEDLGVRQAWEGGLSDDLIVSAVLRRNGLRIAFEPACMLASPLAGGWRQTAEFIRRQYLIGREYYRKWWLTALLGSTLTVTSLVGAAILLAIGLWSANAWTVYPAGYLGVWYLLSVLRGRIRRDVARLYFPALKNELRGACRFEILAGPLVCVANWLGLVSSMFGAKLRWRGIEYRFEKHGKVRRIDMPEKVAGRGGHFESTARERSIDRNRSEFR